VEAAGAEVAVGVAEAEVGVAEEAAVGVEAAAEEAAVRPAAEEAEVRSAESIRRPQASPASSSVRRCGSTARSRRPSQRA
jgi:hypothetical protein